MEEYAFVCSGTAIYPHRFAICLSNFMLAKYHFVHLFSSYKLIRNGKLSIPCFKHKIEKGRTRQLWKLNRIIYFHWFLQLYRTMYCVAYVVPSELYLPVTSVVVVVRIVFCFVKFLLLDLPVLHLLHYNFYYGDVQLFQRYDCLVCRGKLRVYLVQLQRPEGRTRVFISYSVYCVACVNKF